VHRESPSGAQAPALLPWMTKNAPFAGATFFSSLIIIYLLSVCPRAAVATDVAYHHWYDCVCMTTGLCKRLRVFREALYKIEGYYYYKNKNYSLLSCVWISDGAFI